LKSGYESSGGNENPCPLGSAGSSPAEGTTNMRKNNNRIVRKKVTIEKDVMVDEHGVEDTESFKGSAFNRPVSMMGFIILLGGPFLGGLIDNQTLGIILFILGAIILGYASSKKI